ncbi:hypothetical protein BT93_B2292 [Corymbia citriodora subsp. variegata]|nr:hypothetical protein BT93_B2292 [Corymbia citriodora subsp. variegata]
MVIELDMGTSDPHSLSYTSDTNCNSPHCSSLGWDLHNLGVLNADMSLVMGSTPPYFSDLDSDHDLSTGYLEDALLEFSDRSKRRRLSFCGEDRTREFNDHALGYWNSTCRWGVDENYNGMSEITSFTRFSDELGSSRRRTSEEANFFPEVKTQEDVVSSLDSSSPFKGSSRTKSGADKEVQFALDAMPLSEMGAGCGGEKRRRQERVVVTRVVYPFAVVKPGGADGDVTLNDINERLLMPPTRPVRHPVGDFACRPCVSPHGPGLSGKAVVALTRLHTQGRGTITIIRTKG